MNYEDYVVEKLIALENYTFSTKDVNEDSIKIGKLLIEAYHLARLRGYGAEIASIGYYITTSVEKNNEKVLFYPERVDVKLVVKYLKENAPDKIIGEFLFESKTPKKEKRTAGFGSNL